MNAALILGVEPDYKSVALPTELRRLFARILRGQRIILFSSLSDKGFDHDCGQVAASRSNTRSCPYFSTIIVAPLPRGNTMST